MVAEDGGDSGGRAGSVGGSSGCLLVCGDNDDNGCDLVMDGDGDS